MKKFIFYAFFLLSLSACASVEEARFNRFLNSIDNHARPIRWVDEDVFMVEGMTLDWPLPPQGWAGDCLLFVASSREGDRPELALSVFIDWDLAIPGRRRGNYAFVIFKRPLEARSASVNVTSIKGQGGVNLSAYILGRSVCD